MSFNSIYWTHSLEYRGHQRDTKNSWVLELLSEIFLDWKVCSKKEGFKKLSKNISSLQSTRLYELELPMTYWLLWSIQTSCFCIFFSRQDLPRVYLYSKYLQMSNEKGAVERRHLERTIFSKNIIGQKISWALLTTSYYLNFRFFCYINYNFVWINFT